MRESIDPVLAYLIDDISALAAFGATFEMEFVTRGSVVMGTLISDLAYFTQLGKQFREAVEGISDLISYRNYEARREMNRGWDEQTIVTIGQLRERGYERFGEHQQESTRCRVRNRPNKLMWNQTDDEAEAERKLIAGLIGDEVEVQRTYVHLRNTRIFQVGREPVAISLLRLNLGEVTGWTIVAQAD